MTWEHNVSRILGRTVDETSAGSFSRLDLIPENILEDLRKIANERKLLAIIYAHHFSPRDSLGICTHFVEDVVIGGQAPETWRRGDVICAPPWTTESALTGSIDHLLRSVDHVAGERWFRRLPPSPTFFSAPGVLVRDQNYKSIPPPNVDATSPARTGFESVTDCTIAFRRSMAARIAFDLAWTTPIDTLADSTIDSLAARAKVPIDRLSDDGRGVLQGLLREIQSLGAPSPTESIGFRGDDDWYR